MSTFTEFLRTARLHGLSDSELKTFEQLFRAAREWQRYMQHVGDACNFNGTLFRAVDDAVRVFGDVERERDPHMHCHWYCVAFKRVARCAKDQPTVHCTCGILNAVAWGTCTSCKQPLPRTP